jgi:hypothetical protein
LVGTCGDAEEGWMQQFRAVLALPVTLFLSYMLAMMCMAVVSVPGWKRLMS